MSYEECVERWHQSLLDDYLLEIYGAEDEYELDETEGEE